MQPDLSWEYGNFENLLAFFRIVGANYANI